MDYMPEWLFFQFMFLTVAVYSINFEDTREIIFGTCVVNKHALRMYGLSLPECIYECKLRPGCGSVSYRAQMLCCELHDNGWPLLTEKCPGVLFSRRDGWSEETFCDSHCLNGTRCDVHTGVCQIKECQPAPVVNARVSGNKRRIGSKILYTCVHNVSIVTMVTCMEDGTWNPVPTCPEYPKVVCDSDDIVSHWVSGVKDFSSEYNLHGWYATEVIGPPDVYPDYGDLPGAWAPLGRFSNEFLELEFPEALYIQCIDIYETYHGGGVKTILGKGPEGSAWNAQWHQLWNTTQVQDINKARIFTPKLRRLGFTVQYIRLEIDSTVSNDWVEIDAVKMRGTRP